MKRALGSAVLTTLLVACATHGDPQPSASSKKGVEIVHAGAGDVAAIVAAEVARASAAHRRVIVDVGAPWCEPCQRFKAAAEAGELDAQFPDLTLVEFNLDDDEKRLRAAGYKSQYIPLLVAPGPDGRASGHQLEGSIKGPGAVAQITPRLKELLAQAQ